MKSHVMLPDTNIHSQEILQRHFMAMKNQVNNKRYYIIHGRKSPEYNDLNNILQFEQVRI